MSLKKFVDSLNANTANVSSKNTANTSRPILETFNTNAIDNTIILKKKRKSQNYF